MCRRSPGGAAVSSRRPEAEPRPVITLPYEELAAAAAGFGHNFLALDRDGPARRYPPFVRKGTRVMPSLGMAAPLADGATAGEIVGDGARHPDSRSPHPARPRSGPRRRDPSKTHDQAGMLINYRAPALVGGVRPYPGLRDSPPPACRKAGCAKVRQPIVDPAVFKDKIVFVGLTLSDWSTYSRRRSAAARCPASSSTPASPTASCRTCSRPGAGLDGRRRTLAGAIATGVMAALAAVLGRGSGRRRCSSPAGPARRSHAFDRGSGWPWRSRSSRPPSRSSPAPRIATSSKTPRSGKSAGSSAATSPATSTSS